MRTTVRTTRTRPTAAATPGRTTARRGVAALAVVGMVGLTAACGEEDFGTADVETTYDDVEASTEVTTDSIVGLEVTTVGNVVEVLSDEAIRIDRDGLGSPDADDDEVVTETEVVYDYDYYDYGYLTAYDGEFGDDDLDRGVLVVGGLDSLAQQGPTDEVRVSGTIRRFDKDVLEEVYELDLPDDELDEEGDALVIVADTVTAVDVPPDGSNDTVLEDGAEEESGEGAEPTDGASDEASDGASDATEEPSEETTEES